MSRTATVRLFVLAWLAAVWVLLWGDISIANVLAGLAVGLLIMTLLPLPRVPVDGRAHLWSIIQLIWLTAYYALESSAQVAWLAVRPGPPPVTGVLRVRLSIESDLVMVLCCDVLNLIPGTMVIELDKERRLAYVHVLDVGSERSVERFYSTTRRLEQLFIDSFEREQHVGEESA
ncbi:Na+/H+ antiporter subunit E [Antrihabitans cavernicola]|uniref:Na+/H+ antiporter subunit E n=1 Tax=Antrihabitans cavernicola TaxID=2495913 RepID=A0A5A7S7N4_9NOCA|nr:Na+/H+ antiporter subunit E [Spelaeibacter cavernicola]KAA0022160.1 Na+/H+ antiporter subunit E [Spelaeibacter cavernicola]